MGAIQILIADDEQDILDLLREELSGEGYLVHTASNGYEAVVKALDRRFDLVILDMVMPKLNGAEAITILKKVQPGLPVIAFTGHVGEGFMSETMSKGAVDCIKKPFRMDYLKELIHNTLKQHPSRGNAASAPAPSGSF